MRVSCFFVSVAIIFAQQASAAPILGLPDLPLIGNESGVVPRVSNTLEFVPLLEPLIGNARESTSNHGLLSGTELLGTHLLNRRENQELLSSLAPVTDSITNMPLLNSVAPLNPTVHGLVSGVEHQDARASILSGVTNNLSIDLPLHILKRAAGIPFLSAMPGFDMLSSSSESTEASSIPGVSAIPSLGSIPGMSAVGALTSALPMGGLARRDGTLAALPLIGSLPGIGAITSLPGLSSIPSMPSGLSTPGHSTASSLLTSVSSLTGSLI